MRYVYLVTLLAILGFAVAGCSQHDNPVVVDDPSPTSQRIATPSAPISTNLLGYLVRFDSRVFASGQTTFNYTVSGDGSAPHALSHFFMEIPDCAPTPNGFVPSGPSINVNNFTFIYGATWSNGLATNGTQSYSITYPGDVPLGIVRAHVKASTDVELGKIVGPCAGFVISGSVYVDADSNGVQTAEDLGIADVTVRLDDGNGDIQSATTDSDGNYSFVGLDGSYTVRVDAATPETDFNETLAATFVPSGLSSLAVTVGPDSPNNSFGYHPQQEKLIEDLETGALPTDGESAKYWVKQVRGKGKVDFDEGTVNGFILTIEELFLTGPGAPFEFLSADKTDDVLDILSSKSKDELEQLKTQLLVAEFNLVANLGLTDPALQAALLKWAEAVVVEASAAAPPALSRQTKGDDAPFLAGGSGDVGNALSILLLMNGATGGGGGGGTTR